MGVVKQTYCSVPEYQLKEKGDREEKEQQRMRDVMH